jgi:hypothetical protein
VPTLAAQTPLRVRKGRPLRGSCIYWPTAAPLVGNSPRGWAPKTLPNPEVRGAEPTKQRRFGCPVIAIVTRSTSPPVAIVRVSQRSGEEALTEPKCMHKHDGRGKPFRRPRPPNGSPSGLPYRRERPWCPPSRRVPHKWSGRRPIRTGPRSGFPFRTRRTCLSSEGGHQGLPAKRPSVKSDGEAEPARPKASLFCLRTSPCNGDE